MSPIRLRRTLPAITLLTALLVTPTLAHARPSGPDRQAAVASSSFLGSFWNFLTRMWGAEGGSIDPLGSPDASNPSGMSIDSNG
ncbi:MAG TPA: hypothetical protein VFE33_04035 [Thermoanaerobaculia bacterium]|nr:hypothetical protein [Thermoanaerobaculia bacterium]